MKNTIINQRAALAALEATNKQTDEFIKNINEIIGRDLNVKK